MSLVEFLVIDNIIVFCLTVFLPEAPSPPVVSEVHTTSCTVNYQPPRRDGGAPVTGYILERRTPGPDSEWIRVNDTPVTDLQYTIDNLTPATQYEFRVAAVNKKGTSDFSLMSPKILAAEKPDRPGVPEVVDVTGTSVGLQWTAASSNGADITHYFVIICTPKETKQITVPADTGFNALMNYTIRNQLQANSKYRFAVSAINRVGQGPQSDMTDEATTYAGMLSAVNKCSITN